MTAKDKILKAVFDQITQQVSEGMFEMKYIGPVEDLFSQREVRTYNVQGGIAEVDASNSEVLVQLKAWKGDDLEPIGMCKIPTDGLAVNVVVETEPFWAMSIMNWVRWSELYDLVEEWELNYDKQSVVFTLYDGNGVEIAFDSMCYLYIGDTTVEFDPWRSPGGNCWITKQGCERAWSVCICCPKWFEWFEKQCARYEQLQRWRGLMKDTIITIAGVALWMYVCYMMGCQF